MALRYRMYQEKRKTAKNGFWYAHATVDEEVGVKQLAERISNTCTVTESDIVAVIAALVTEMKHYLTDGKKVRLQGLGSFKPSFSSRGVRKLENFVPTRDIHSPRVLFLPETMRTERGRVKALINGMKVQELKAYKPGMVELSAPVEVVPAPNSGGTAGQQGGTPSGTQPNVGTEDNEPSV